MRVVASRAFPGPAWEELGDVDYVERSLADVDGARVRVLAVVAERVDDDVLDRFPDLRLVANYGVGYDLIDVDACARRGVAVTNTPGVLDAATAELAFALILAVRRRVVEGDRLVREGRWRDAWHWSYLVGDELAGSTLGVVGLGRIGRAVAARARAFEMHVLYTQRNEADVDFEFLPLDDLLRAGDVVSLHVPLTEETRGLIDARRLALLRDEACLVNTARGQIVDERALVHELVSGRIRAGLDVFAHEPSVPQELLALPNVVLTPHMGSATSKTREAMTRVLVDNILALERGDPLPTRVA